MSPILGARGGLSASAYGLFTLQATNSYESIQTYTLTTTQASIDFTSIPSTYKHLQLRIYQMNTATATTNLRMNNDSGSNYARHYLYGGGSSAVGAAGSASQTSIGVLYNESTSYASVAVIDLLDYTSTNKNKTVRSLNGWDANGSGYVFFYSGLWMNSSTAVDRLTFTPDGGTFASGTRFALYGIKG